MGQLLLERIIKEHGENISSYNVLDRLAIVGTSGKGTLTYQPAYSIRLAESQADLDELARQCQKILLTEYSDKLDELYQLGGTSGGARPKIMTQINDKYWIIKFPAHVDKQNSGKMEYDYSLCARKCGIEMTETRLFPSQTSSGYFGTKRFDRVVEEGCVLRCMRITVTITPKIFHLSMMKKEKNGIRVLLMI